MVRGSLPHPLPKLIDFLRRQRPIVWAVGFDVTVDSRHELPHRHVVYLLRREPNHGSRPVDRSKSQLSVWEFVKLSVF